MAIARAHYTNKTAPLNQDGERRERLRRLGAASLSALAQILQSVNRCFDVCCTFVRHLFNVRGDPLTALQESCKGFPRAEAL